VAHVTSIGKHIIRIRDHIRTLDRAWFTDSQFCLLRFGESLSRFVECSASMRDNEHIDRAIDVHLHRYLL